MKHRFGDDDDDEDDDVNMFFSIKHHHHHQPRLVCLFARHRKTSVATWRAKDMLFERSMSVMPRMKITVCRRRAQPLGIRAWSCQHASTMSVWPASSRGMVAKLRSFCRSSSCHLEAARPQKVQVGPTGLCKHIDVTINTAVHSEARCWPNLVKGLQTKNVKSYNVKHNKHQFVKRIRLKDGRKVLTGSQCIDRWWQFLDLYVPCTVKRKQDRMVSVRLLEYVYSLALPTV